MSDDFAAIDGGGDECVVVIKGKPYSFGALKIGQLPAFARAIKPMASAIERGFAAGSESMAALVLDLVSEYGDNVLEAVCVATRIPRDQLEDEDLDKLLEIVPLVLAVNRDFLLRRLSPALMAAASKLRRAASPGAGPTPAQP